MKIKLKNTRIESLNFSSNDEIAQDKFELSFANGYSEKEVDLFVVRFEVQVGSEHGYELQLEYVAEFQADASISSEFRSSHFPKVNAPAIAYPYLRSFVSLLTLNAGYEALILPTINFQAMSQSNQE